MSRSRKHNPAGKITKAESNKQDKQSASRKLRRSCKQKIRSDGPDVELLGIGTTDPWLFAGDGKQYWKEADEEFYRK